jgi:hypothetical protein
MRVMLVRLVIPLSLTLVVTVIAILVTQGGDSPRRVTAAGALAASDVPASLERAQDRSDIPPAGTIDAIDRVPVERTSVRLLRGDAVTSWYGATTDDGRLCLLLVQQSASPTGPAIGTQYLTTLGCADPKAFAEHGIVVQAYAWDRGATVGYLVPDDVSAVLADGKNTSWSDNVAAWNIPPGNAEGLPKQVQFVSQDGATSAAVSIADDLASPPTATQTESSPS